MLLLHLLCACVQGQTRSQKWYPRFLFWKVSLQRSCSTYAAFLVTISHSLLIVLSTAADLVLLSYTKSLILTHLVKKSMLHSDLESVHDNMDIETNTVC